MVQLNWTKEAQIWLREIYDYITIDNPDVAMKIVDEIYTRTEDLVKFPRLGHRYENLQGDEIRVLLYGHYRIAYMIVSEEQVNILGVFHGRLDIDRFLFE